MSAMDTGKRLFPIQSQRGALPHPLLIPWSIAELAYSVYSAEYGRGQSLERLAERGGFGPFEMDAFCPGWRELCSELERYKKALQAIQRWDCLNPPQPELCADFSWLKKLVDDALAGS